MPNLTRQVPEKLIPLLANEMPDGTPVRNKAAYGGRGGAKSHFFAEQLIIEGYTGVQCETECDPLRAVCLREIQKSLKESVHQLLVDKIQKFDLGRLFDVQQNIIKTPRGGEIIFQGLQTHTAESIKSIEGMNRAWKEESQTVSAHSDKLLRPTIRRPRSQVWDSWNPRHDTDAVDKYYRGSKPRSSSIVVEVNWQDNPWFGEPLLSEMREDYENDPDEAEHVWGGGYQIVTEGAYYAKLLARAEREGRTGDFPYNPRFKVSTSWDLGVDDYSAVWFFQEDGEFATAIDYYEVSGDGAAQIISTALPEVFVPPPQDEEFEYWTKRGAMDELERDAEFKYGAHYLPHDIQNREWGAGARSRKDIVRKLGLVDIRRGGKQGPVERVNAARALLPRTRFNTANPRVALGVKRLRRYRRKYNDTLESYTTPLHDINSHGSDSFGEFAINCGLSGHAIRQAKTQPVDRWKRGRTDETTSLSGKGF